MQFGESRYRKLKALFRTRYRKVETAIDKGNRTLIEKRLDELNGCGREITSLEADARSSKRHDGEAQIRKLFARLEQKHPDVFKEIGGYEGFSERYL
jgi:hypothetical protein